MNPAGVTVALRLGPSDGALLDRGFIGSLWVAHEVPADASTAAHTAYILSRGIGSSLKMTQSQREQQKLRNRIRRIRGQIDAIERALAEEASCAAVLQQATACRGALDGLIAEIIEDHIHQHLVDPKAPVEDPRNRAAEELVEIVHSYLT